VYASATPAAYDALATLPASWRATIAAVAARPAPTGKNYNASPDVETKFA
jgi:hypothetical protein